MKTLKSNPMRYFYIVYSTRRGLGVCNYTNTKYPNRQDFEIEMKKDLGIDSNTGLKKEAQITDCHIEGLNGRVVVIGREVTIDKNGNVDKTLKTFTYTRFDKLEVRNEEGEIIEPANLKLTQLAESQVGQMIKQMCQFDLQAYDGTEESLKQN